MDDVRPCECASRAPYVSFSFVGPPILFKLYAVVRPGCECGRMYVVGGHGSLNTLIFICIDITWLKVNLKRLSISICYGFYVLCTVS